MDAPTMATLRLQAIAMAHGWLMPHVAGGEKMSGRTYFLVRGHDLGLKKNVLGEQRIRIEITVEDDE